ncbi:MAG TPA: exodeoxyribonuclease VII large subunit [Xanthobacteraceae bacterium]|nr:exodeoxyribonuclease VII large subunit [Xanthobacteraceae bacterium]
MSEAVQINVAEFTVSELSAALKRTVEEDFSYVRVRGELGNVKYHTSGHVYLDLKDDKACLAGVIWRNVSSRIKVKLEAGLEVVVTGRITTYPAQSKYQIVIETLEPAGLGALMALLDERKRKLAAEGLFDEARKQLLPFLPTIIGVVTSPTGAVIRDILHRLNDRFPRRVLVWPVRVQGETSAEQVAAAIRGFNALPAKHPVAKPDVIIVARGGGSLEDLWSFNEEIVVRAAAESMIPIISAVGHETDVTLIDFAADRRAPTPTAAAEMAVPVRSELIAEVDDLGRRRVGAWIRCMDDRRSALRSAARALPQLEDLLSIPRQRFDNASDRLPLALRTNAHIHHVQFSRVAARLVPRLVRGYVERRLERLNAITLRLGNALKAYGDANRARIERQRERVTAFGGRATRAIQILIGNRTARMVHADQLLSAYSYRGVLNRGFALVRDMTGKPVRLAAAVNAGMRLDIEFTDGRVSAIAERDEAASKPRLRRGGGGGQDGGQTGGQGSLFGS